MIKLLNESPAALLLNFKILIASTFYKWQTIKEPTFAPLNHVHAVIGALPI